MNFLESGNINQVHRDFVLLHSLPVLLIGKKIYASGSAIFGLFFAWVMRYWRPHVFFFLGRFFAIGVFFVKRGCLRPHLFPSRSPYLSGSHALQILALLDLEAEQFRIRHRNLKVQRETKIKERHQPRHLANSKFEIKKLKFQRKQLQKKDIPTKKTFKNSKLEISNGSSSSRYTCKSGLV